MDPATLIPRADPLMMEWGWFQGLLNLTFLAHILLVNLALGLAVVAFSNTWCGQDCTDPVGKAVSTKLPTIIALTVNFGVAPLLFLQTLYGHFFYVSDILMGWYWLSVPFLIIVAYYMAYLYDFSFASLGSFRGPVIGLGVFCLLCVAFLFVNNLTMMNTPERWPLYFERDGIFLNWGEPTLVPRYLHFVLASLAVGGLATALYYSRASKAADPQAGWHAERGMKWFFRCTAAQIAAGVWFLLALPRDVMLQFMGGSGLGTALFLSSLLGAAMCLHAGWFRQPKAAAFYLVCTVAFMTGVREIARMAYTGAYYSPADLEVIPQYTPFVMFVLALALGAGIVTYVLRLAAKAGEER